MQSSNQFLAQTFKAFLEESRFKALLFAHKDELQYTLDQSGNEKSCIQNIANFFDLLL